MPSVTKYRLLTLRGESLQELIRSVAFSNVSNNFFEAILIQGKEQSQ